MNMHIIDWSNCLKIQIITRYNWSKPENTWIQISQDQPRDNFLCPGRQHLIILCLTWLATWGPVKWLRGQGLAGSTLVFAILRLETHGKIMWNIDVHPKSGSQCLQHVFVSTMNHVERCWNTLSYGDLWFNFGLPSKRSQFLLLLKKPQQASTDIWRILV